MEDQEISVRFIVRAGIFLFSTLSGPEVGPAQPPLHRVPGTFSAGIKPLERESDQIIKFRAKVNNTQIHTSTASIRLYYVVHKYVQRFHFSRFA